MAILSKEEFENEIILSCPNLFKNSRVSDIKGYLRFGFDIQDGWYDLVRDLCTKLEKRVQVLTPQEQEDVYVQQVKEKWGGLRFYMQSPDEGMHDLVHQAEERSIHTCEWCGEEGKQRNDIGWVQTLCPKHYKEVLDERKSYESTDN